MGTTGSLVEALLAAPRDQPFVTHWRDEDEAECVTFGQFIEQASAQSLEFRDRGLRRGDRVVLIMPQGIPLMAAFAGAMMLGAIPAILAYPNFKVESSKYRSGLEGVTRNLSARLVVLDNAFPDDMMNHVAVGEGAVTIRAIRSGAVGRAPQIEPAGGDDIAFIQHSAGTTGLQKGVALSHSAVLRQLQHLAARIQLTSGDRIYSWLPLYHDMGLIACFMLPVVRHVPVVMQDPLEWVMQPDSMLRVISSHRCTLAWLPNFSFQFVPRRVPATRRAGIDLSSIRALINCSEPVQARSFGEFYDAFHDCGLRPAALQSSYAMAENVFAVTQSDVLSPTGSKRIRVDGEIFRREQRAVSRDSGEAATIEFVSSGTCLDGNEVRIADADGRPLPDGHVGEIQVRSDSLFTGYYDRDDLTAQVLRDGWYRSGDLGFVVDRELYVVGRARDLIIVGGKNIYPQDVEEIVCSHPQIHDGRAVAFGLFDPDAGTENIVVVAEAERLDGLDDAPSIERELLRSVTESLGVTVRRVFVKPPRWLVKSTAGKLARAASREKLLAEHPELVQS